jgi:hypothetical protein
VEISLARSLAWSLLLSTHNRPLIQSEELLKPLRGRHGTQLHDLRTSKIRPCSIRFFTMHRLRGLTRITGNNGIQKLTGLVHPVITTFPRATVSRIVLSNKSSLQDSAGCTRSIVGWATGQTAERAKLQAHNAELEHRVATMEGETAEQLASLGAMQVKL